MRIAKVELIQRSDLFMTLLFFRGWWDSTTFFFHKTATHGHTLFYIRYIRIMQDIPVERAAQRLGVSRRHRHDRQPSKMTPNFGSWAGRLHAVLGVFRQSPTADACIQLIEECVQPTVTRLTSGHLLQDFAHFRGGVLDRPADLTLTDVWIATVVELKSQCGIGCWTDNVLCLVDIRQWMRVSARRCKAGGMSGCCCSGIVCLTCSGIRRPGKGTQLSGSLSPTSKHPNALNRGTRPGV